MATAKILIADDDKNICELLKMYLEKEDYEVVTAGNGEEAIAKFDSENPDLILLDVMMPKLDGWQVCRELRKKSECPIIMITAKGETFDKVLGLELGADDYVTKPFSTSELVARVDAIYRRVSMSGVNRRRSADCIELGEFKLNLRNRSLSKNGKYIELTQVEFQMMEYFFTNPGVALSRTDILDRVWGNEYFGEEKIIDVNIRRLRMKVEDDPSVPKHLTTIWGVGYKWII